ncbi:MAG: hypothetical protein ACXITV_06345 [Luteibaculaceae bacterium]
MLNNGIKPFSENFESLTANNEISEIERQFSVAINDFTFKLGYISTVKKLVDLNKTLEFKIYNDYILPEFDVVKSWFAKKLGMKTIKVRTRIKLAGLDIVEVVSHSSDLDKINSDFIDSIRYQATLSLKKAPTFTQPDKNLFTSEDIFNQFDEQVQLGNVFNQQDADILKILSEQSGIRNRKQLNYLSGKLQSDKEKIR